MAPAIAAKKKLERRIGMAGGVAHKMKGKQDGENRERPTGIEPTHEGRRFGNL
jgi:hypothetical protein